MNNKTNILIAVLGVAVLIAVLWVIMPGGISNVQPVQNEQVKSEESTPGSSQTESEAQTVEPSTSSVGSQSTQEPASSGSEAKITNTFFAEVIRRADVSGTASARYEVRVLKNNMGVAASESIVSMSVDESSLEIGKTYFFEASYDTASGVMNVRKVEAAWTSAGWDQ